MMNASRTLWRNPWKAILFSSLLIVAPTALGQNITIGVFETPVPGPRGDATVAKPMTWVFTQPKAGGGLETKTVNITNLPRRAFPAETAAQAADRKADTLVTEFNNVLGAGRAEKVMVAGKPNVKIFGVATGRQANGQPINAVRLGADPTLQAGNGGRFRQGSGGKMSMGAVMELDGAHVATGIGPDGESSLIQFGVEGLYIASLNPSPGSTALSVLSQLSTQLTTNGVVNSFDAAGPTLTIEPLYDSDFHSIFWTSTDEGLPFGVGVFAVPEPVSWLLLATVTPVAGLQRSRANRLAMTKRAVPT